MVTFEDLGEWLSGEITEESVKAVDVTLLDELLRSVSKAQAKDPSYRDSSRYRVSVGECQYPVLDTFEQIETYRAGDDGPYAGMPGLAGPVREWHVDIRPYKARNRQYWDGTNGYCYLGVITARHRPLVAKALGKWPTIEQLLTLDVQYTAESFIIDKHDAYHLDGVCVVLRDLFVTAARRRVIQAWPPRSYGEALARSRYHVSQHVDVSLTDVVGGKPDGARKVHGLPRKNPTRSYRYAAPYKYQFPVTEVDARSVLAIAKANWQVEHLPDIDVLAPLVPLLCYTTSPSMDVDAATFPVAGCEFSLRALSDAAKQVIGKRNSLRLWVKSYERGMLCIAMSSYLQYCSSSHPARYNAGAYDVSDWNVRYAFDCAHILRHVTPRTFLLRRGLRVAKHFKFKRLAM